MLHIVMAVHAHLSFMPPVHINDNPPKIALDFVVISTIIRHSPHSMENTTLVMEKKVHETGASKMEQSHNIYKELCVGRSKRKSVL